MKTITIAIGYVVQSGIVNLKLKISYASNIIVVLQSNIIIIFILSCNLWNIEYLIKKIHNNKIIIDKNERYKIPFLILIQYYLDNKQLIIFWIKLKVEIRFIYHGGKVENRDSKWRSL